MRFKAKLSVVYMKVLSRTRLASLTRLNFVRKPKVVMDPTDQISVPSIPNSVPSQSSV